MGIFTESLEKRNNPSPCAFLLLGSSPVGFTNQCVEKGHVEWLKEKVQAFERKNEANQCLTAFKKKVWLISEGS